MINSILIGICVLFVLVETAYKFGRWLYNKYEIIRRRHGHHQNNENDDNDSNVT